jgi:hypothetical protein
MAVDYQCGIDRRAFYFVLDSLTMGPRQRTGQTNLKPLFSLLALATQVRGALKFISR